MGDDALGITGTTCYTWGLDNEVNAAFTGQYDSTGAKHPGWCFWTAFSKASFPSLAYFTIFAPVVIILILRPQGLFGKEGGL